MSDIPEVPPPGIATPGVGQLHAAVRRGSRAVVLGQIASQLISLTVLAGLYRLILPDEFGLLGMVLPIVLLVRLFTTMGLNVAVVQRQRLSDGQLTSLLRLNLGFGLLTALVIAGLAPGVAWFYSVAELNVLTIAMAGTALMTSFGTLHLALLERELRFGPLTLCRVVAQGGGGAAGVAAGAAGAGVWALVTQQYVELTLLAFGAWMMHGWRPGGARPAPVRDLMRFGGYYTLSSLMFYLTTNVDKVLIGALSGPRVLGLYSQAFNLMMRPVALVSTPLTGITLPALSRAVGDASAYRSLMVGAYRLIAVVLWPVAAGLMVYSDAVMLVLGGPEWVDAGPLLQILAIAIFAQGFVNIAGSVLASLGRADRLFQGSVVVAIILCQAFVAGWWLGDRIGSPPTGPALGVAWGYSLAMIGLVIPYTLFCLHTARVAPRELVAVLRRPAAAAAAMCILLWALRNVLAKLSDMPPIADLAIGIVAGIAAYAILIRKELRWLLEQRPSNH